MFGGFAMQDMQSSRPASGAEHMFSHLLEMRDHVFKGEIVPHGIQVGVFTLFMCRVYEQILAFDYSALDVERCLGNWKPLAEQEKIGSSVADTLADVRKTIYMRDRYMALDFLDLTGQLDSFAAHAL